MPTASQTPKRVHFAEPQKNTRLSAGLLRDRITVVLIMVAMAALVALLFFLAGLAGTSYWPVIPC